MLASHQVKLEPRLCLKRRTRAQGLGEFSSGQDAEVWLTRLHWLKSSFLWLGRGCGAVGRAVASDTRDPRFESQHPLTIYLFICQLYDIMEKTKIKKTRLRWARQQNILLYKLATLKLNLRWTYGIRSIVISTNSQTITDVFTRGMEKGGFCRNSPE